MIPSLKKTHETHLKKQLLELKNNPKLLQEYYDQKQLEEMSRALRKANSVFKRPEFESLQSFKIAFQKAYAELENLQDKSKLSRVVSLGSELKRISTLILGISKLFEQLPHILEVAQGALPAEWDADEPISAALSQAGSQVDDQGYVRLQKLRKRILKAMKPGALGINNLPYINANEAASELLDLSINNITELSRTIAASHIMRQTMSNPSFIDQVATKKGTTDQTSSGKKNADKVTVNLPGGNAAASPAKAVGIKPKALKAEWDPVFDQVLDDKGIVLDDDDKNVLRTGLLLAVAAILDKFKVLDKSA